MNKYFMGIAKNAAAIAAVFACVFGFTACQSLAGVLQEPVLSIASVETAGIGFDGVDLICKVNVENPNAFNIPFPHIDWQLFLNENSFVKGAVADSGAIRARRSTVVDVPVRLLYADVLSTFASLKNAARTNYKIALDAKIPLPLLESKTWHLEQEGVLPVVKVPAVSFGGIALKNISLSKLDLEINWEVDNPNNFAMTVKDLSYNLSVNDSEWASGNVPASPRIGANGKTRIPLTFSVNKLALVKTITALITRGNDVSYACGGAVEFAGDLPGLRNYADTFNFSGTTKLRR